MPEIQPDIQGVGLKGVLHVLNFKDEIAMGSWEERSPRSELRFQ